MGILLRDNKLLLSFYVFISLLFTFLIVILPKAETHLLLNSYHNTYYDLVFTNITILGNGLVLIIISIILLFFSIKDSVFLIISWLISSLIFVLPLKYLIFPDIKRPYTYFEAYERVNFIEGVQLHSYHSFPSGHTTTAFVLFFGLSLILKKKQLKLLFLLIAFLVAFSRVYLWQHFLEDVIAGSFFGVISTLIGYLLSNKLNIPNLKMQQLLNKAN